MPLDLVRGHFFSKEINNSKNTQTETPACPPAAGKPAGRPQTDSRNEPFGKFTVSRAELLRTSPKCFGQRSLLIHNGLDMG